MAQDPRKVLRKVHFYTVDAGRNDDNSLVPFDFCKHLKTLQSKSFELTRDNGRRMEEIVPGKELCGWVFGDPSEGQLIFGVIRKNDLPQIEKNGSLEKLPISRDTGLVEVIHVSFFENNLVAADFNFHGPRAPALGRYFDAVFGYQGCCISRLGSETALKRLIDAKTLKKLSYRMRVGDMPTIESRDDGTTIDEVLYTPDELEPIYSDLIVTVTISQASRSKVGLPDQIRRNLAAIVPSLRQESSTFSCLKATVCDEDDNDDNINFFDDVLVVEILEMKPDKDSRAVLPDSAFLEIRKAFDNKKDEIMKSVPIQPRK